MMKAINFQIVDRQRELHMQAWLNVQAKATKQRGKKTVPYFKTFDDFFKDPMVEIKKKPKKLAENRMYSDLKSKILIANTGKND